MNPAQAKLETRGGPLNYIALDKIGDLKRTPKTVKILIENIARRAGERDVSPEDVKALAEWPGPSRNIAFMPSRVLMQDFTGVPAVVDLAAMRSAVARAGKDPSLVNPFVPVDLIIDHSVQVDEFGKREAYARNIDFEYHRNSERYALLNWAQQAFSDFRVVPPGMGICHQVNLEHLGQVVAQRDGWAFPDTLVGTDSHTTMINGLGILGWGVGGIEAEAAMLGQPMFLSQPVVLGVRTVGKLPAGSNATDLVLTFTQMLRARGVVGKFVEFFGDGLSNLSIADRATISNMSPEFGVTSTYFPVDANTLHYLQSTGRGSLVPLVEMYTRAQGLFREDGDEEPTFNEVLDLDLSSVQPSVAGPKRPQDLVPLGRIWDAFKEAFDGVEAHVNGRELARMVGEGGASEANIRAAGHTAAESVTNGSVVIAAITSCTNTSNPSVMIAAGLLARKAVEAGLQTKSWVKTSLAPGSRVVTQYLEQAGLTPYLEKLGFNLVGYGCTTCIGNSGPLPEEIAAKVTEKDLAVVAVLSGNRNFEGRIHPQVRASFLASPPLCVAFALKGSVDWNPDKDPIDGDIFLKDIWPSPVEVQDLIASSISASQFEEEYGRIFEGDERWREMKSPTGKLFDWDPSSTYVREPPYFLDGATGQWKVQGARVLASLGDSVTTDHISPAGSIKVGSDASDYLKSERVDVADYNSYGSRRGNHEVMIRGTLGNIRIRNALAPGTEGPRTIHIPSCEQTSIYEASLRYAAEGTPLIILAGKEYGSGSSRDWAAKGVSLLGVRAAIAETYERIHRSNLVGMGVLPLQFLDGESASYLGLTGLESFDIDASAASAGPGQRATVTADGKQFEVLVRIDTEAEVEYFASGGILSAVLKQILD